MPRQRWLAWFAIVVLGGCGQAGQAGGTGPTDDQLDRLRAQAREVLDGYDRAVRGAGVRGFVPTGPRYGQIGHWEPGHPNGRMKALSGRFVAAATLPGAPQPTGQVVWDDGSTLAVPLASAGEALNQLNTSIPDCPGCQPLDVTGASLTTMRIATTRGTATVPAWAYTLKTSTVGITQLAVADSATVTVTPLSADLRDATDGLTFDSATTTSVSSRRLTVAFTGANGPASEQCGADYRAEAVESAHAVAVMLIEHRNGTNQFCPAIGERRTATVELTEPLGERTVLEVRNGQPVPVTITG